MRSRQKVDQQLRRGDKGVDAGRVVRRVGIVGEVVQASRTPS